MTQRQKGALYMILSALCFASMQVVVRLSREIPTMEQIFMRIGFLTVSIMVAKLGTDAFAAHQVGMNVMSLSFSFGDDGHAYLANAFA